MKQTAVMPIAASTARTGQRKSDSNRSHMARSLPNVGSGAMYTANSMFWSGHAGSPLIQSRF